MQSTLLYICSVYYCPAQYDSCSYLPMGLKFLFTNDGASVICILWAASTELRRQKHHEHSLHCIYYNIWALEDGRMNASCSWILLQPKYACITFVLLLYICVCYIKGSNLVVGYHWLPNIVWHIWAGIFWTQ